METIHEMCMQGREEEEEEEEFSSKRIRISYNEPEELKLYRPLNTWTFFANNPIPFVIEHRSLHLHSLNVKVEDLISSFENKSVIPETVLIQFEKISAHLFQHVIKCRNSMPRKHKMLLWVIRSRIDLIKHSYSLHKSKDYGNIESLAYFEKLGLLISAKIVQDYTLKELADMQIKTGLLSEAQMGFAAENAFEKARKNINMNPLSLDFKGRELSQKLGGWIENSAKMKSFLIDYDDIMKGTKEMAEGVAGATSDNALKYAERKAKKWWLDYSDLTDFEQKVMKNVIPFYTWMRKNIRNQLEGILVYPQTFSIFPKTIDAMTYDDPDFDPESIPDWMKD
ncbi:hypothetical protein LCGC14_2984660, partial [marine sediment metagenome]